MRPLQPNERIAMLVGPGVLRAGPTAIAGLHAFAAAVGVSVLNTYGAKGVFVWDSPYHAGTVGLQERDWELGGLVGPDAADVVITSGLDPAECVGLDLTACEVWDIEPADLGQASTDWNQPGREPVRPPIYAALAEVAGPLYGDLSDPPNPARAAAALAERIADRGTVVGQPGRAGWWIARTFPTRRPGSVVVPSSPEPEALVRAASAAVQAGPVILVVNREAPPGIGDLQRFNDLEVVVWDRVSLDFSAGDRLVDVAGPVTAWPGLDIR